MQISVSGHGLEAGEAFRDYATAELEEMREKYFKAAISASVTLAPGPHGIGFVCEAMMHVRGNVILKGGGRGSRAQASFDGALAKIDKQLRRHVRRLHDHVGMGSEERIALDAGYTVLVAPESEADAASGSGSGRDFAPDAAHGPLVIAEAAVDVPRASVADAVWMLDLRNTNALLFTNVNTGALNMVYRREDGNIGWVEPGRRGSG